MKIRKFESPNPSEALHPINHSTNQPINTFPIPHSPFLCSSKNILHEKNESLSLQQMLKQFIKDSTSGKRKMPNGKTISPKVIFHYHHALQVVAAFDQKQATPFHITLAYRPGKILLTRQRQQWKKFGVHFLQYLYGPRKYADQMVDSICKIIRTALNYARLECGYPIGETYKLIRVPMLQTPPVVLLPEQLSLLIYNQPFHASLPLHLQRSKDLFVFGCTTGLRVSDLMQLKKQLLLQHEGQNYLRLHTRKTGTQVQIPLPDYCMEILKRQKKLSAALLFAPLSITNFNLHIKQIGKLAGWTYLQPKYRSYKGVLKEEKTKEGQSWRFYQHLTAHTMRRTAITTLLMMGVEETVVRRISGHAPASKEFYRYVVLAQSYMDQQVQQAFIKLSQNPSWYRQPHP